MQTMRAFRQTAKWFFMVLGVLAVFAFAISLTREPELRERLRAECRARYAAAHDRGDSILADNWIPAPGLQGGRTLRHCSEFEFRDPASMNRPNSTRK